MNDAIKHNAISESDARSLVGDQAVDAVLDLDCEFTNRLIDDFHGVVEMGASIDLDDGMCLSVLYLVDKDAVDNCEGELDRLDYSDYTFVVE